MSLIKLDVTGQTCPVPLVEVRKALRKAQNGDVIEVTGTHEASKREIPMAVDAAGKKIEKIIQEDKQWKITIKC